MSISHKVMSKDCAGLAWEFHVSPASCDNPAHYEQYIRLSAVSDRSEGMGTTHIFVDDEANEMMGYVTLRATSLISENERGNRIVHPALEIAELAVAEKYERLGVGTHLVRLAILVASDLRENLIGFRYVVLCADPKAVGFYEKQKFGKVRDVYEVLRDGSNDNCEAMFLQLPPL